MGLRALFSPEVRAVQDPKWGQWAAGADVMLGGNTAAGVSVDPESSLRALTVYGCVNLITSTLSTLPVDVYRTDPDGTRVDVGVPPWLRQPNPDADWLSFCIQVGTSWLLDGNAYVAVLRDQAFRVKEAVVLHPARVQVQRTQDGAGREYLVDGIPFRGELKHVPAMIRPQALKGLSPIDSAREAVGLELAGREFGARFFGSGAHLSGVIESPGPLTQDQAKILKQSFAAKHGGLKRSHLPGVLTEGAKWTPISISPEQAQFLDTRRFTAAEIASLVFGVDPAMLGLNQPGTSITYANLESRGIHFVQFTMLPWIVRLERLMTSLVAPGEFVKLNVDGLLRADTKTRYDAYAVGVEKGWLRTNEVRELEDLPPIEGGGSASPQEIAVMLQKIYLAVGKVISAEEAREIVNRAGGDLSAVLPDGLPSVPVAMADTPPPQEGTNE